MCSSQELLEKLVWVWDPHPDGAVCPAKWLFLSGQFREQYEAWGGME